MVKLAWLSKAGSFWLRRRLAASKALKRFNGDALLDRRTNVLALYMHGPFEPVSWAYSIRADWTFLTVESERNAMRPDGP